MNSVVIVIDFSFRYQMSPSPLMPNQSSSYGQLGSPFAATSAGIPAHSSQHRPNHQHFNTGKDVLGLKAF